MEKNMIYAVIDAIDQSLVGACHDISNGGLACTVSEMALTRPSKFGFELDLDTISEKSMRTDKLLFSESAGFVLEARKGSEATLIGLLKKYGLEVMEIGQVANKRNIVMKRKRKIVVDLSVEEARKNWTEGLAEAMR
jgi:phosphoribosylformylglycinamidine synthase